MKPSPAAAGLTNVQARADNAGVIPASQPSTVSAAASFHVIDRRRRWLANLAGVLLSAMCLTLVLISGRPGAGLALAARWPTIVGLVGLVAIFLLYLQLKQRELMDLEGRLRDAAVREAATMARFEELSSLFDAGTQLQLRLDLGSMLDLAVQRLNSSLMPRARPSSCGTRRAAHCRSAPPRERKRPISSA